MSATRRKAIFILVTVLAVLTLIIGGMLITRNRRKAQRMRQQVQEVLAKPQLEDGQTVEWLADLGPDAAPFMVDAIRDGYQWPGTVFEAILKVADRRTVPGLVALIGTYPVRRLEGSEADENAVEKKYILRVLGKVGDSSAQPTIMKVFEDKNQDCDVRVTAARALLKMGDSDSRRKVKHLVLWLYSQAAQLEITRDQALRLGINRDEVRKRVKDELCEAGFRVDDGVQILLDISPIVKDLQDVDFYAHALKWEFLLDAAEQSKEGIATIAKLGNTAAVTALTRIAESDPSMWPHLPPGKDEKGRDEKLKRVPSRARIEAVTILIAEFSQDVSQTTLVRVLDAIAAAAPERTEEVEDLRRRLKESL